jgi:hypothetical protein
VLIWRHEIQLNDTQHKGLVCVTQHNNAFHYNLCLYAERHSLLIVMLSVVVLSVVMQNVIMLNVVMLGFVMLNVVMLGFVMLNVIMISVS